MWFGLKFFVQFLLKGYLSKISRDFKVVSLNILELAKFVTVIPGAKFVFDEYDMLSINRLHSYKLSLHISTLCLFSLDLK